MKSAYELAMERLQEEEPDRKTLTDEQKKELAELNKIYEAKIAERNLFLSDKIKEAFVAGQHQEAEQLKTQLINEKALLEEELEEKKDQIRNSE